MARRPRGGRGTPSTAAARQVARQRRAPAARDRCPTEPADTRATWRRTPAGTDGPSVDDGQTARNHGNARDGAGATARPAGERRGGTVILSLADARRVIAAGERRARELGQPMNI